MSGMLEKITNWLMPMEEVEESVEEVAAVEAVREEKKVVNGAALRYETTERQRPVLTVHTTKIPELKIMIFAPAVFDEVNVIADALKQKKAVVVNYEKADSAQQRRLCDFINGVCYVLNGEAKRISETMVLYVPENVEVGQLACARKARA